MVTLCKRWLVALFILGFPIFSFAAVPTWKIVPADSSINFTATQNGAPVTGKFQTFSGNINFAPDQLSASNVTIVVDVGSVSDAYNQLTDILKTADWFNVKLFPQATFKSTAFTKTGDKTFEVKGLLTIRNKTLPVTLNFTQEEYSATKARMKGSTVIQRTAFGVGQREWVDTKTIKDEVRIDFVVVAAS
jgi:polyisoprenoid-binding protein YceI